VNCVLVAKDGPLEETAEEIRREAGVEVVTAAIDPSAAADAADRVFAAAGDREVACFINNAVRTGSASGSSKSMSKAGWPSPMLTSTRCFVAPPHRRRNAQAAGAAASSSSTRAPATAAANIVAIYCASKAFQLNFAESFWSEMRPYGVDVCTIVLGRTNTPGLSPAPSHQGNCGERCWPRRARRSGRTGAGAPAPWPITNWGQDDDQDGYLAYSAAKRREKVIMMETLVMQDSGYKPETDL
jgi:NAD(P)-dependent dehydrogenase (short-subunit alcohol dehydrogenase family)